MKPSCAPLPALLALSIKTTAAGVCCLYGRLESANRDAAAASLACSIAAHRLTDERLFRLWHRRAIDGIDEALSGVDPLVLQKSLLENVGTPLEPAAEEHLYGLVAERIWQEVVANEDVGLGVPIRVEGHDWSVTDPGGDGLTVYESKGHYSYRLWESKFHGNARPLTDTVNTACRQVRDRALDYLARFSLVAQHLTDDQQLATFYARIAELWADKDTSAGVGIVVGSDVSPATGEHGCFNNVTSYFGLTSDQHQGNLNLVDGFPMLAKEVQRILWKGCGLWIGP